MDLPLAGKSALVTGGSRGIGAAVARRLAADGANVVVNYASNPEAAQMVVDELNAKRSGSAVAIKADLSKLPESLDLFKSSIEAFGKIDVIVFNAAIMGDRTLTKVDELYFNAHFDVNVKSPLFIAQAAEPYLTAGMCRRNALLRYGTPLNYHKFLGSRLIFISSTLTQTTLVRPNTLMYVATKGAIEQITRVLARELGEKGVTVNCLSPGPIDTDMFRSGKTEQQLQSAVNFHPLKRIGQPSEVADVVAFLAGPESSWVNGQNLQVNGVRFPIEHVFLKVR